MTLQVGILEHATPQPWRNGGGVTRELLTWPSAQAWGLRISVADIERDGPFSAFPGIDRWLVVLEGPGVTLDFDGGERRDVRPGDEPFAFDGGRSVQCTLRGGATRDLNVMAARNRGSVSCTPARPGDARSGRAGFRAVFAQDALRLAHGARTIALDPMSLAWSTSSRSAWTIAAPGRAWWIEYEARGR